MVSPDFAAVSCLRPVYTKSRTRPVYKGSPHGLCTTEKDRVNEDLLAFFKG